MLPRRLGAGTVNDFTSPSEFFNGTNSLSNLQMNSGGTTTIARKSSRKLSTTHHLHQASDIIDSLHKKSANGMKNADIKIRSTKIVCTLGRITRDEEAIAKMVRKGMNVARINMNYFEIHE